MTVHYTREGPVAWLTIDRPEARNALSAAVRAGLWDGVRRFVADDAAVLVLTGAGNRAFCAGGDLKEMADAALEVPPPDFLPQFGRNIDVPKPTIAAVNGVAYAGGFLLAQQCDLVVAAEHAAFAVTEVRVGRGAPWAAPLPWLVGPRAAAEILLTGEPVERGAGVRDRAGQPGGPGRRAARADAGAGRADRRQRAAVGGGGQTHGVPVGARGGGRRDLGAGLPLGRRTRGAACLPGEADPRLEGTLMPVSMSGLADDLAEESAVLRALLVPLDEAGWRQPTPAAGWSVLDQVTHLAWFDEAAVRSAVSPEPSRPSRRTRTPTGWPPRIATGRAPPCCPGSTTPGPGCSRCSADSTRRCGCPGTGRR